MLSLSFDIMDSWGGDEDGGSLATGVLVPFPEHKLLPGNPIGHFGWRNGDEGDDYISDLDGVLSYPGELFYPHFTGN